MGFHAKPGYSKTAREALRAALPKAAAFHDAATPAQILAGARAAVARIRGDHAPRFMDGRLELVELLIRMVNDRGFGLEPQARARVYDALCHVAELKDPIPNDVPLFGYIDDALMIDQIADGFGHQIAAYRDFCAFRRDQAPARGLAPRRFNHAQWVNERRAALSEELRRRNHEQQYAGQTADPAEGFRVT